MFFQESSQFLIGSRAIDIERIGKLHSRSRPNQSHQTFGNHSTIENRAAQFFVLQAASHHRALCGMKTANGTTCNCNEQHREDRQTSRMVTSKGFRYFRQFSRLNQDSAQDTHRHKDKGYTEQRINSSDKRINRQKSCQYIITENYNRPCGKLSQRKRQ